MQLKIPFQERVEPEICCSLPLPSLIWLGLYCALAKLSDHVSDVARRLF